MWDVGVVQLTSEADHPAHVTILGGLPAALITHCVSREEEESVRMVACPPVFTVYCDMNVCTGSPHLPGWSVPPAVPQHPPIMRVSPSRHLPPHTNTQSPPTILTNSPTILQGEVVWQGRVIHRRDKVGM